MDDQPAWNARPIMEAGFTDVVGTFTPGPPVFTYWDYTQLRFPKNRGMRIDFILASPALAARVSQAEIVRDERKGTQPNDHGLMLLQLGAPLPRTQRSFRIFRLAY